jgi:phenylpyruvate tautomerase PptA (4-oxalocrotonate tautomerase family)
VKVKKQVLAGIVERLSATGFDPENLMVVFQDVPWENWSPAGGRVPHA